MSEQDKKQNEELKPEDLEQVAGGAGTGGNAPLKEKPLKDALLSSYKPGSDSFKDHG